MKLKRLLSLLIIVVMLTAAIPFSASAGVKYGCDKWAEPEMKAANEKGLLTPNASRDFKRSLTRDEFCELVVVMAEELLGYKLPVPSSNPFTDSNSIYVQKAFSYGIVNGVGNNKFDPDGNVQRQQIATMMIRTLSQLEKDTGLSYLKAGVASMPYKDGSNVNQYAIDAVKIAYSNGIMHGDEANRFNPLANINSQECVAVIYRCYNSFDNELHRGFSTEKLIEKAVKNLKIGYAFGENRFGVLSGLDLPTTGVGGSTITWVSSNPAVISTAGVITVGSYPANVTLTATLKLGSLTRTKTFTVTTSTMTFDRLQLENAIEVLDIYYCIKGDSVDRVTGRIGLPYHSNGLSVKWTSSNESVVSSRGVVNPPKDDSVISVTLTATITKANQTRNKTFVLKVSNPAKNANLSLHGISLGMTQAQVTSAIGSAKRTLSMSSTESWQVFHNNFSGLVAVGYISNKVTAVYSMSSNATSQFRNTTTNSAITLDQAKTYSGAGVKVFTDANDSGRTYAVMLHETNTALLTARTLYADGTEQLLADIINAFRVQKNISAFEWNAKLATAARTHSTDMSTYNYFNRVSQDGSTHLIRAERAGYERNLAAEENIAANGIDAIDFLNSWVNSKDQRTNLLTAKYTVAGIGYASGTSYSSYKNYCTIDFGTLIAITGVTTNPSSIVLNVNETRNISLSIAPSNRNETFTVSSSNTGILTASNTNSSPLTVSVKGLYNGTANIVVRGNSSGTVVNIPVSVGSTYASSLSLNHSNFLMGTASSAQLVATTAPTTGPIVTWSSNDTSVATVNSAGVVTTAAKTGTAVITATVRKSATENITRTVTISVISASVSPASPPTMAIGTSSATLNLTASVSPSSYTTLAWSSSNANIAAVSSSGVVSARVSGYATIYCTITRSGYTGSVVKSVNVTVTGQSDYAADLTLSQTTLALEVGEKKTITATMTPTSVKYGTMTWSSENPAVATVSSNGEITATGVGTTKINVSLPSGSNGAFFLRTVDVTVTAVKLSISISTTTQSITLGERLNFIYTILPSYAPAGLSVTWISSDTSVATIDSNGLLTPGTIGETVITAKINDTSVTSPGLKITVTAVSPTGISVTNPSGSNTVAGGTTAQLVATASPVGAPSAALWSSSNADIATVDVNTGLVTFSTVSTATTVIIRATSVLAPSIYSEYTFTVTP